MSKKAFVALVTCFNADETINYEATRAQVRRQVAAGNNIMCAGTNGDFSALTFEEKVKLAETVVDEVAGKVDVIVNAGMPATFETLKLAKEFDRIGVTAIAVITPFFIACTQDGLIRHFSTVADAVRTPIYLYDIPARTQNHIEPETARTLAAHGNIAGIKDSGGAKETLEAYLAVSRAMPGFDVYPAPTIWCCGRCRTARLAASPVLEMHFRTRSPAFSKATIRATWPRRSGSRRCSPHSGRIFMRWALRLPWSSGRSSCKTHPSALAVSPPCFPIRNRMQRSRIS